MDENLHLETAISGKGKHYSPDKLLNKVKKYGTSIGYKALYNVAILYCALKSPDLPKEHKLMLVGVLGYFILPIDLIADMLPAVGLADDIVVITKAISVIYTSITDEMKEEAHQVLKKVLGDKYMPSIEYEI
ncbi:YkvA family protein [Lysinibacillus fusiformis]|nr:YkvA family protein [Lysinibacillus fusiformis]